MCDPLASAALGPTPVAIPIPLLRSVYREARRAFPGECCGWLSGPRASPGIVDRARPCTNAQERGQHPTRPDRTVETAYVLSTTDLLALNHSFDGDEPARVIYHSHPNGRAYFSATDREVALSPWSDGPAYPVQHLVVGIDARRVNAAALFAWSAAEKRFVEVARYAGEDS